MSHIEKSSPSTSAQPKTLNNLQDKLLAMGYEAEFSRRGAIKAALALAGSAVLFGMPNHAFAAKATQETLDALASAEEQLNEVQAQLDAIAAQYQALSVEQSKTIDQIEDTQKQIDATQEEIDTKQKELEDKQAILGQRVSDSYKKGPNSTLNLLLSSETFDELLSNSRYVEKFNDSDKKTIDEIQTIRAELESQKAELETLEEQQATQLQEMQAKQAETQEIVNGLSADVKELMEKRDCEYLAAVEAEKKAAAEDAAAAAANRNNSSSGGSYAGGNGSYVAPSGSGTQQAVVAACHSTPSPGANYCAMWVSQVFRNAGLGYPGGNACDMYRWCTSSDRSAIQVGMIVAVSTYSKNWAGQVYGHVGIYVGNNTVMENIGYIASTNLDTWISYYGDTVTPRWGWVYGRALS